MPTKKKTDLRPPPGKPLLVTDGSDKRVLDWNDRDHVICKGLIRYIGINNYLWENSEGEDGKVVSESQALLALGYYIKEDGSIHRTGAIKPKRKEIAYEIPIIDATMFDFDVLQKFDYFTKDNNCISKKNGATKRNRTRKKNG